MTGGSGAPNTRHGQYLGDWGNFGSQTQKGITSYALSPNRQRPLAGALNAAIFNSFRRFNSQVLYFAPPLIGAYLALNWAIKKNEYYNSKPARMADEAAQEAIQGGSVRG